MALAEELHFGRAAARCHISQPPFSVSIRQLEGFLGYELVERTSHEVRLTAAGAAYYVEAGKVLVQLEHAERVATRVNKGLQGIIRVGFFASMLYRQLDHAILLFGEYNPDVDIQLVELNTADQIPALLRKQIDYGFVHSEGLPPEINSEVLMREPFVLCTPKNFSPITRPPELADFRDTPFILFSRSVSPIYYDQVISLCVNSGFHPVIKHEARHWLTVIACVAKGMGVTLVPKSMIAGNFPEVKFHYLEPSRVESVVRGVWRAESAREAALVSWHSIVRKVISSVAL